MGDAGIAEVLELIKTILPSGPIVSSPRVVLFVNASNRRVTNHAAADPDVSVVEEVANTLEPVLAIEVKAGIDASNRLNRPGEAEKSHLKAKSRGHARFWTIVRVPYTDAEVAANSPTTQKQWHLDHIKEPEHPESRQFVALFKSYLGIP